MTLTLKNTRFVAKAILSEGQRPRGMLKINSLF